MTPYKKSLRNPETFDKLADRQMIANYPEDESEDDLKEGMNQNQGMN